MNSGDAKNLSTHPAHTAICGLLMLTYLCGFTLDPALEKVGQIGLLLWSLGFCFMRPWREQRLSKEVKWVLAAFLAFFLVALVAHLAGEGGRDGSKMLARYARFLLVFPLYYLLRRFLTLRWLGISIVLAMFFNGVWGLLEYAAIVEGCTRDMCWPTQVSASLNPIQYGNLILCLTLLYAVMIPKLSDRGLPHALAAWCLFAVGMFLMFSSHTRGAMITLPVLGIAAVCLFMKAGEFNITKAVLVAVITALCSISSWQQVSEKIEVGVAEYNEYENLAEEGQSSIGTRMHMWRASLKIFVENPVLGVGPGQYKEAARKLHDQGQVHTVAVYRHPHSEVFSVLSTRGVAGLLSLVAIFAIPLWYFYRALSVKSDQIKIFGIGGSLIVFEVAQAGITETIFDLTSFIGFYLIMVTALLAVISRDAESMNRSES